MPVFKNVNKDFFKKWTPEMAYVLGFFAADGYITVNKRGGQFWCIQITDKDLIMKVKKVIRSDHKISIRMPKKLNESILYRLQIGSVEMCDDLRNLGMFERKTKSLVVPNVPQEYFPDFVRGYFDGDGNVWVGFVHKDRLKKTLVIQVAFTSCSKNFLDNLNFKIEEFGIKRGVVRKGVGDFYRLVCSVKSSLKLYKFMYNRTCIKNKLFLKRKKVVFDRYIKNICIDNAVVV